MWGGGHGRFIDEASPTSLLAPDAGIATGRIWLLWPFAPLLVLLAVLAS